MQVDGACHCGKITYRAEIDPQKVRICHCSDCQTMSGSAFRTVTPCAEADFTLLTGTPKVYLKTAESGNIRQQGFCGDCGTALYATSAPDDPAPRIIGLRIGAIRQRDQLIPNLQYWARSAVPWLAHLDEMAAQEKQ